MNEYKLNQEDFGTLCICAIRYCHGRQTYMPDLVRKIVRPHLHEFSDKDLSVMIQDCEFQANMHLYGDERIDKPGWIEWKQELLKEEARRKEKKELNNISWTNNSYTPECSMVNYRDRNGMECEIY